jgi:hypothetical protein
MDDRPVDFACCSELLFHGVIKDRNSDSLKLYMCGRWKLKCGGRRDEGFGCEDWRSLPLLFYMGSGWELTWNACKLKSLYGRDFKLAQNV